MNHLRRIMILLLVSGLWMPVALRAEPSEVWVDDDFGPGTEGWGTTHFKDIQPAIVAVASGGTVHVYAGTYVEQLEISKVLTLDGAGTGQTIVRSPAILALSFVYGGSTNKPIVYIHDIAGVNVSDLTVDGYGRGNANVRFEGIAFWNAGGTLEELEITGVRDTPFSGAQHGVGIYARNSGGGPYSVTLAGVEVTDFQKNGMALLGNNLTVDLDDCEVTGVGPTATTAQNGIQIGTGAGGSVTDCTVSGIAYSGGGYVATAMLFMDGTSVDVTGGAVSNSQVGVIFQETQGSVEGTDIGAAAGLTWSEGVSVRDYGTRGGRDGGMAPRAASPLDVEGRSEGSRGASTTVDLSAITFTAASGTNRYGAAAWEMGDPVTMSLENSVASGWEVAVLAYAETPAVTVIAHENDFSGNDYGFYTDSDVTQDASGNWWGTASPAGVHAKVDGLVDYTPWLTSAADMGDPGFQGDFSTLWVDDDSPQTGTNGRVEEGIGLLSGSTLNVAPGTYVEAGQIVIDRDVTILGNASNKPVIQTDGDTGSSGDAKGWWLVQDDQSLTLKYLVLDGAGYKIYQGIRAYGAGTIEDCVVRNMLYEPSGPTYGGVGIVFFGDEDWTVKGSTLENIGRVGILAFGSGITNSVIEGNTYTGKGTGNWLDYGIELGGGAVATVTGNTITNCLGVASVDGSTSAGVLITTYFGSGTAGTLIGNSLTGNSTGIAVGYDVSDASVVVAHYNDFSGNADYGITSTNPTIDALRNWWGDVSGPHHDTLNPTGTGVPVSDHVSFDPWTGKLGGENVVCDADPEYLRAAPENVKTVAVKYLGGGGGLLYGYSVSFAWNGSKVSTGTAKVAQGALLSSQGSTDFHVSSSGTNEITVDCALLGDLPGVTGPGTMFTIEFTGLSQGTSPVDLTVVAVRDRENNPLTGFYEDDGLLIVDVSKPVVAGVFIENVTLTHTDDYIKNGDAAKVTATVTDDDPGFGLANIRADLSGLGAGAAVAPDTYVGGVATWATMLSSVTCTPANGPVWVRVTATDAIGNSTQGLDDIHADNIKPGVLTGLTATPGHKRVNLSWSSAAASDSHYAGVVIRYARWNGYPTYPLPAPSYPADQGGGIGEAYNGTATSAVHDFPGYDRDIYYYGGFVYDIARNYSVAAGSGQDRATNYWLGDVRPYDPGGLPPVYWDGYVTTADISALGATYYVTPPTDAQCDVGPTDDHSRIGIPQPDNRVNFEDLMVFAMNFGVVTPLVVPPFGVPEVVQAGPVALSLEVPTGLAVGSEFEVTVKLEDRGGVTQGVRFVVGYDPAVLRYLGTEPGALVSGMENRFFMPVVVEGQPDVSAAVLGEGATFGGSGELAQVRFRVTGVGVVHLELRDVVARNALNEDLLTQSSDVVVGPEAPVMVPVEVYLRGNQPNPFATQTEIAYGLPRESRVSLAVYDVSGRQVRMLEAGRRAAGEHVVQWDRRDNGGHAVAGGLYFYRLDTDDRTLTKKMIVSN